MKKDFKLIISHFVSIYKKSFFMANSIMFVGLLFVILNPLLLNFL